MTWAAPGGGVGPSLTLTGTFSIPSYVASTTGIDVTAVSGSAYMSFGGGQAYAGLYSDGLVRLTAAAGSAVGIALNVSGIDMVRLWSGGGIGLGSIATDPGNGNVMGSGAIKSNGPLGGIGYATGAGGTVSQLTSKSTGVTLNKVCGKITLNGASLAANGTGTTGSATFTLTNSAIAADDYVMAQHDSVGTIGAYKFDCVAAAGSAAITVRNISTGALAEAIVIKFVVIKSATA